MLKLLNTEIAVTPIEQVTPSCGKRKIHRAISNAVKAYENIKQGPPLNSLLLFPVLFESLDDNIWGRFPEADLRDSMDGMMIFAGQNQMSLAAKFDSVRNLRQTKGEAFLIGAHQNATPVFIATMSLAGVDFFQTDYPLELALQGLALKL